MLCCTLTELHLQLTLRYSLPFIFTFLPLVFLLILSSFSSQVCLFFFPLLTEYLHLSYLVSFIPSQNALFISSSAPLFTLRLQLFSLSAYFLFSASSPFFHQRAESACVRMCFFLLFFFPLRDLPGNAPQLPLSV